MNPTLPFPDIIASALSAGLTPPAFVAMVVMKATVVLVLGIVAAVIARRAGAAVRHAILALTFAAALGLPLLRGLVRAGGFRALAPSGGLIGLAFSSPAGLPLPAGAVAGAATILPHLALIFLKVGSILFGSGYVLLAFLRPDLVERTGWLTDPQLLDAVAIGQFTPGPVLTAATFVGYLVAGVPGAVVATVAIFLPAFVFVAASSPLVPRLRGSPWAAGFLDGANAASVALMAGVTWELARAAVVDGLTAVLALGAAAVLLATRLNSAWLVAGGAAVGGLGALLR